MCAVTAGYSALNALAIPRNTSDCSSSGSRKCEYTPSGFSPRDRKNPSTRGRRHIRKRAERFAVRDGCGQTACGGSCKFLSRTHRGEHGKSPPVGAERLSFADRSHTEKVRIRFGCARNFAHAVPVSVRFHHEKHAHARACAHRLQIAAYSAQIDFRVQVHFPSDCNILCCAERKSTPRTAGTISAAPPLLQRRRS